MHDFKQHLINDNESSAVLRHRGDSKGPYQPHFGFLLKHIYMLSFSFFSYYLAEYNYIHRGICPKC